MSYTERKAIFLMARHIAGTGCEEGCPVTMPDCPPKNPNSSTMPQCTQAIKKFFIKKAEEWVHPEENV